MNKPNWKDAPEWANYVAMDESGAWWWYESEPSILGGIWDARGRIVEADVHIAGWNETLEGRP